MKSSNNRMLMVLYGAANQGKTLELYNLLIALVCGGSISPGLAKALSSFKKRNGSYIDNRFVIDYEGAIIVICSGGDTWSICKKNTQVFDASIKHGVIVYRVTSSGIDKMTSSDIESIKKADKPIVCVTACRPSGDAYGAFKVLHAYSEKSIMEYDNQVWLHKKRNISKLHEMHTIIDNFIKKGQII
ncbi:hypothetical protein [Pseudoprevotella muciniphila]|nr:hypothetical protein [Pseudoprevotella muciniphila]